MPAYFSLTTVFNRKDIYPDFTNDFYNHLIKCGLKFKSGYYDDKKLSLREIISWNQRKLENNFHLGMNEHYSNGYKQILFNFCDFKEVRGYWDNNSPTDDEFTFSIIFPEHNLVEDYSTTPITLNKKIKMIQDLAISIWEFEVVQSLQTSWELGDNIPVSLEYVKNGELPTIEPFAIIPKEYVTQLQSTTFTQTEVPKNGVLLHEPPAPREPKFLSPFGHIVKFFKYLF